MARGGGGTSDDSSVVVAPRYNPVTQQWEYPQAGPAPKTEPTWDPTFDKSPTGGTASATPAATEPAATEPPTQAQYDALAILSKQFKDWGIDVDGTGLSTQLWQWIVDDRSPEGILTELRKTKAYSDRFTGMADLVKRGQFMDEATYIEQERAYRATMVSWGIPSGFYDSYDDYGKFISNGVSVKELDDRIKSAKTFIDAAPEYKAALNALGIADGTLMAHVLDGDRAQVAIQKELKAAAIGGAANKYGFGLNADDMNRYGGTLGDQFNAIGVDQQQSLESTLSQLGTLADQDQKLSGIDNEAFDRRDTLDANLMNDQGKQLASKKRAERESARFSGSSGFTTASLSTAGGF